MPIIQAEKRYQHKLPSRMMAGVLVVAMSLTMVVQSATSITISRSDDEYKAAVNYLADNTEYVQKPRTERVVEYIETRSVKETLADYYRLAGRQIAKEQYKDALVSIEKCIAMYEDESSELYLDILVKRGCLQVMLNDYDAALKSLDLALAVDSTASDIYLVKAQIYAEREDVEALEQCLTAYLELKPGDNSIRELLAQIQFTEEDYQTAAEQYEKILETDSRAEIEYLYGLNAVKDANFAVAEASLTSAMAKDDSFDGIYYYRGVSNMSLGSYELAIDDLTVSIGREDMLQASYYTRGVCLLMDDQYEKGILDIEYAASRDDDEEITKQAQLLLDELEAALAEQPVQPEGQVQAEETTDDATEGLPTELLPVKPE